MKRYQLENKLENKLENRIKRFMAVVLAFLLMVSGLQVGAGTVDASTDTTFQSTGTVPGLKNLITFEGIVSCQKYNKGGDIV